MRPEEVLSLPLIVDGGSRPSLVAKRTVHNATGDAVAVSYENDDAAALVAMCNAYPLALALADALAGMLPERGCGGEHVRWCNASSESPCDCGGAEDYESHPWVIAARSALAAFLAHRTPEDKP